MPHIPGTRAGSLNASVPLRHTCNTGTAAFSPQTLQLQACFMLKQEALENIPRAGHSFVAPWHGPLAAAGCTAHAAAAAADERVAGAGEHAGGSSWSGGTWRATVEVPGPSAPLGNEQRCSQGGRRMGMTRGFRIAQDKFLPQSQSVRDAKHWAMQKCNQKCTRESMLTSPWQSHSHHPTGPGAV